MSKVMWFTGARQCELADKINMWLLQHPDYRIVTMSVVKSTGGFWNAWVSFESV